MAATMHDVARRAGVSIKTVSNVINNRPYIRPETKQKVLLVIEELGYRPNRQAQALRNKRNTSLAAIIPDIMNPFFTAVVRGIEDYALEYGYLLLLCNTEDNASRETRYVQALGTGLVSGVALCTADERILPQQLAIFKQTNTAVVLIDRTTDDLEVSSILADNYSGSYSAISHLISTGHQRIGIIAGPEYFAPGRERLAGYLAALNDAGIAVDDQLIHRTDFKMTSSQEATNRLLNLPEPPSALFISNGPSAYGAMEIVRKRCLSIPEDLSIVVFDDPEWSRIVEPPLSVVAQPGYEMGRLTAKLLIEELELPGSEIQKIRLPTSLIHRKSCCVAEMREKSIGRISGDRGGEIQE